MGFHEQTQQHIRIRERLSATISEQKGLAPSPLKSDRLCPTGCWLHGDGGRRWAGNHAFLGPLEAHRAFHVQAGAVAEQINRGQFAEAQRALRNGTPFSRPPRRKCGSRFR